MPAAWEKWPNSWAKVAFSCETLSTCKSPTPIPMIRWLPKPKNPPTCQGDTLFCTRPSSNECYGMCGPGCTCWSWVCGDCCYHYGCARHDSWCRQGQWYYCYNITAVIALFGC